MSEFGVALQMIGVSKRYPGTLAVDDVDLIVHTGEVHALIGENGAGKSTLMKILAGAFDDYTGDILIGRATRMSGKPVLLHSPAVAITNGIQMIHQELSLAPPLSLAENVLAGRLPRRGLFLDRSAMLAETRRCLARVGLDLNPETPIEDLSLHEAQLVEIAKALGNAPTILVMDEPTSALSRDEVTRLFDLIRRLRQQGLSIIYISHHLPEILEVADRVTILRDGRKVATEQVQDVTAEQLVERMVGRSVSTLYPERQRESGDIRLRVESLSRYGFFHKASFHVRAGEILGIGGLAGAGRSELARSLCGIDPIDAGKVYLDGKQVTPRSCRAALKAGLAYLTEDRKQQGLALRMTLSENSLSALILQHCQLGLYSANRGRDLLGRLIHVLDVTPPEPGRMVSTFSGGNQQKALLAKWLATDPAVLVLDEPTRGVDVGAKVVIHKAIAELADSGKCVVLISSDLPELVGLADRVIIMRQGRLIGEIDRGCCSEATVLLAANGEGEFVSR